MQMLIQIEMGNGQVLIPKYYIGSDSNTGYKISLIDRSVVKLEAA